MKNLLVSLTLVLLLNFIHMAQAERLPTRSLMLCINGRGAVTAKTHCKRNESQVTVRDTGSGFQILGASISSGTTSATSNTTGSNISTSGSTGSPSPSGTSNPFPTLVSAFPTTTSVGTQTPSSSSTPTSSTDNTNLGSRFTGCYSKGVNVSVGAGTIKGITLVCDDSSLDFMTGRAVRPIRNGTTGIGSEIVQQYEENFVASGAPVGTYVQFTQIQNSTFSWGITGGISCCRVSSEQ